MNKELTITNEDIELLKEMKNNCLKSDIYNDEKRLLKANAITKFLLLQQENEELKRNCNIGNENLSFYRNENKELHNKIDKAIEYIEQEIYYCLSSGDNINIYLDKLLEILKDSDVDE